MRAISSPQRWTRHPKPAVGRDRVGRPPTHERADRSLARRITSLVAALPDHPWLLTTDWTYLRFHGPEAQERKYWGRYGPTRLEPVAERIAGWLDDGCDAYAYFNNDHEGHAAADAAWLAGRLRAPSRSAV